MTPPKGYCDVIREQSLALDAAAEQVDDTPEVLALMLHDAEDAYRQLNTVIGSIKAKLRSMLDEQGKYKVEVPGLPPLVRTITGATTRWDGTRLASVIASRYSDEVVDPATGSIPPLGVVCAGMAERIVECAGLDAPSKGWRKRSLKKFGLDANDYKDSFDGTPTVRWEVG